ncbi:flagellar motor switch phosphatase FliY [Paenibacillus sp. KN14-4R]|uniref:flagellar motor switch phosphatase FliY n=1 Tax=Paenibacillus sp. KN14-4R TaxID=3445773 RepID=UPI003FA18A86
MTGKDYLSQEEIDALLKQTNDTPTSDDVDPNPLVENYLSMLEQDALGEIGNITFGSAATALSTLLGKKVEITTPQVSVIAKEQLIREFPRPHVAVHVNYVEGFNGINLLVIQTRDAQVIADLMMGGDGHPANDDLSEIHISAVQEAMNQMMGSSATSMSTIFNRFVNISPPGIDILNLPEGEGKLPQEDVLIKVSFRLTIGDLIDSNIMQLLPIDFAREMVTTLIGDTNVQAEAQPAQSQPVVQSTPEPNRVQETAPHTPNIAPTHNQYNQPAVPNFSQQPPYDPGYQAPMYQQTPMPTHQPVAYGGMPNRNVHVQPAQFADLPAGGYDQVDATNLGLLLDIPLKVTVELGRTHKEIKEILELSQGSIIELDKLAGEPVDILVNNKLIAKGEVVVIDENFGVRVTDIVSQWDRMQKIR